MSRRRFGLWWAVRQQLRWLRTTWLAPKGTA